MAALANTHAEHVIKTIAAIARGDGKEARAGMRTNKDKRKDPGPIPWHVQLMACALMLDRAAGKPFQSVQIFDEKDVTISFEDPRELRQKLIDNGVPAAMLPAPADHALTIDAEAVREEVERDNEELRRKRSNV